MKIGIGSYAFRWAAGSADFTPASPMTAEQFLEAAARMGAESVQLCDNMPLDTASPVRLAKLRQQAADLNLELELGVRCACDDSIRRHLRIAEALGASMLRIVLAPAHAPDSDATAAFFRTLVPILHERRITLAIENHVSFQPQRLARLVATVNDPHLGVCLDPLNSIVLFAGVKETVDRLLPYTVTAHVKDAAVTRRGVGYLISGRPLGRGNVGIRGYVRRLLEHPGVRSLHLESWMDYEENEPATLERERLAASEGIELLKSLRHRA